MTTNLREWSSVHLPGVDEGPSCCEPQNKERLEASTPKNQSLTFLWLCSLPSDITGDVPYHHLTVSVKELTYSSN